MSQSATDASQLAEDPFGWVGQTVEGKYEVEKVVGEGGFAVVYRGQHKGLEETVAIKCLKIPRKLAGEDRERFLKSFVAEGKLLHKLSRAHAGIVQALDVGATHAPNGAWTPYIVLEWLDGKTLEDDLRGRERAGDAPRSLGEAIAVLEPAARALASAHAQGVAHRDVKPANLFLATVGGKRAMKVLDFGIAKVLEESADLQRAHETTGTSLKAFTPRYGAPEQFDRRFGATGPWTDVFALALIVVEMVAGRPAMRGDASQLFVQASNIQRRPTLREAHDIDEGDSVEAVLRKALSVEPKERYANAGDFWDALIGAAGQAPTILSTRVPSTPASKLPSHPPEPAPAASTLPDGIVANKIPSDPPIPNVATLNVAEERVPQSGTARRLALLLSIAALLGGVLFAFYPRPVDEVDDKPTKRPIVPPPSAVVAPLGAVEMVDGARTVLPPANLCAPGFFPHTNERFRFTVCVPGDLQSMGDGSFTGPDQELRVRGGMLDNDVTLETLFAKAKKSDLDHRWITEPKYLGSSFELTGYADNGQLFSDRTAATSDRYASFTFVYPKTEAGTFEAELEHMTITFAAANDR